jgi:hypothetical protein
MRVVIRQLLKSARDCNDRGELTNLLGALVLVSTRVAGLMKTRSFRVVKETALTKCLVKPRKRSLKNGGGYKYNTIQSIQDL